MMAIDGYRSWNHPWYYDLHTHHWQALQNCFAFSRNWLQSLPQSSLCSRWRVTILGWILTITLILILILIMILILVLSTVCHCVCFQKLNQAHWQRFCCVKDNFSFGTSTSTGSIMILILETKHLGKEFVVCWLENLLAAPNPPTVPLCVLGIFVLFFYPFFSSFSSFFVFSFFFCFCIFLFCLSFFVCYLLCPWLGVCKWELPESSPPSLAPSFVYNNISFVFWPYLYLGVYESIFSSWC